MRIELEIDDKYEETVLRLFSGNGTLVAFKYPWTYWQVKDQGCNCCGACCKKEACIHLSDEVGGKRLCRLVRTGQIPFRCASGVTSKEKHHKCSLIYKVQK